MSATQLLHYLSSSLWTLFYRLFYFVMAYYLIAIPLLLTKKLLFNRGFTDKEQRLKTKKLMVLLGSGGHTTEMLMMLKTLNVSKYGKVVFVVASSDSWSITKASDFMRNQFKHKIDLKSVLEGRESREKVP